jgi:protein-L-isoaspartate(D-aspartate) O-methyltransferase
MTAGRDRLVHALASVIADPRVLEAIGAVPRARFVPADLRASAWNDEALPLPRGQSISQPRVVARMCELLRLDGSERVLDVGTGSGYHAAVLARLARHVWSIERDARLSAGAAAALATARVDGVTLLVGDGTLGVPEAAPFDAISVAATAPAIPPALLEQLAPGGRLVLPLAEDGAERLVLVERDASGAITRTAHDAVRFVPLVQG